MADDKKKKSSTTSSLLIFAVLIALFIWLVAVFAAQGEDRLEKACAPISFVTQLLREVVTALAGEGVEWPLEAERYMVSGCYYAFSIILSEQLRQGPQTAVGGIQN